MRLGAFSISLAVKSLAASRPFYEALGFEAFAGDPEQGWLMMRDGRTVIGLFQGMFEKNMLTFNPGWDQECNALDSFEDVREIQKRINSKIDATFTDQVDENGSGPGYFTIVDPDGNPVLFDQHV